MTRLQSIIIGMLVGLPFILFAFLSLYNPRYMANFFDTSGFLIAPNVVIFLGVANFLLLYFGFRNHNKHKAKLKPDEPRGYPCREIALIFLSFLLFTLPSLWLVFLYPAVVQVMQMDV